MNYYRITGYAKDLNVSFVIDCYGAFQELWQFSSFLVKHNCKILYVGDSTKFLEGNCKMVDNPNTEKIMLRAATKGMPLETTLTIDGIKHKAVQVDGVVYVPEKIV